MARASRLLIALGLLSALGCTRDNPAFDGSERGGGSATAHADDVGTEKGEESGTSVGESGSSETDATTTTTTEGESSSESTSESSSESTSESGGSSSEEGPLDTGFDTGGPICVAPDPNNSCQLCVTSFCCVEGIATCFAERSECSCVASCVIDNNLTPLQCANECEVSPDFIDSIAALAASYLECKANTCSGSCG